MKLLKSKSGKLNSSMVNTVVLALVLIVVVFQVYAELIPTAQTAGNSLNASNRCVDVGCFYNNTNTPACQVADGNLNGCNAAANSLPLGALFSGTGVVFVIIMAALLIVVVKSVMKGK